MGPEPDDLVDLRRMRAAHAHARAALAVAPSRDGGEAWGWRRRTLGRPVTTAEGPGWLRVASVRADQIVDTFWSGTVEAQQVLPSSIPRPRLRRWHDWSARRWRYRGELYDYVMPGPIAPGALIVEPPSLRPGWWTAVHVALDEIARVDTTRMTVQPEFLTWALPHYLGVSADDYAGLPWTTAHGDFHFANMCAPVLHILDWEGWGGAPAGYDAATLRCYSVLVPDTTAQVDRQFASSLRSPSGRFAELTVITELLHASARGVHHLPAELLRRRASQLLGEDG